jgi:hypothetical protein
LSISDSAETTSTTVFRLPLAVGGFFKDAAKERVCVSTAAALCADWASTLRRMAASSLQRLWSP